MTSEIITAYQLPYVVLHHPTPLFRGGQPVSLHISLERPLDQKGVRSFNALVTAFYMLASTGALAGDSVPPWVSTVKAPDKPKVQGQILEWVFPASDVDERSGAILAQLFLMVHEKHPLSQLVMSREGGIEPYIPLAQDPALRDWYPPHWWPLPFTLHIDDDAYQTRTLYAVFKRPLTAKEKSAINVEILTWATATAMGAYGIAPLPPQECSIIPDESVTFVDQQLEWTIHRFRAHTSALFGLVNVCAAIDHKIAPIADVRIE